MLSMCGRPTAAGPTSERAGVRNLFWQAADGAGAVERLTDSPNTQYPTGVSPDGRRLIFTDESPTTGNDVMAIELEASRRVTPLVQSPFIERNGTVSPDGHWLAYEANDSGRFEIYVRPFPEANGGLVQVSTTGGTRPIWTGAGRSWSMSLRRVRSWGWRWSAARRGRPRRRRCL
jgi:serine/threonine-protein kinase